MSDDEFVDAVDWVSKFEEKNAEVKMKNKLLKEKDREMKAKIEQIERKR